MSWITRQRWVRGENESQNKQQNITTRYHRRNQNQRSRGLRGVTRFSDLFFMLSIFVYPLSPRKNNYRGHVVLSGCQRPCSHHMTCTSTHGHAWLVVCQMRAKTKNESGTYVCLRPFPTNPAPPRLLPSRHSSSDGQMLVVAACFHGAGSLAVVLVIC